MATALAEGWPALTERGQQYEIEAGPQPGEGPLSGPRWLYVWNRDALGECCCWKGSRRLQDDGAGWATGQAGNCQRPGKHPWVTKVDGEAVGFAHGAADALEYEQLIERFGTPGGARQLGVVLDDVLVVDLDSPRALRDFARMSFTVPKDKILGVSTSPRGYHVWLDVPGWNQRALNLWMTQWLAGSGGWSGTDEAEAGRRGFLVDVRTGTNRYVVWPGQHPDRRWISRAEFGQVLAYTLVGMPAWRMVADSDRQAPWAVDTGSDTMAAWIEREGGGAGELDLSGLTFDGSQSELEGAWAELERWIERLETAEAGSGRNNLLNQIAYHSGGRAVAAGHSPEDVEKRLIAAGHAAGTHGVSATVRSGLYAGIRKIQSAR